MDAVTSSNPALFAILRAATKQPEDIDWFNNGHPRLNHTRRRIRVTLSIPDAGVIAKPFASLVIDR